jgi:hypothetical protein
MALVLCSGEWKEGGVRRGFGPRLFLRGIRVRFFTEANCAQTRFLSVRLAVVRTGLMLAISFGKVKHPERGGSLWGEGGRNAGDFLTADYVDFAEGERAGESLKWGGQVPHLFISHIAQVFKGG